MKKPARRNAGAASSCATKAVDKMASLQFGAGQDSFMKKREADACRSDRAAAGFGLPGRLSRASSRGRSGA